MKIAEILYDYEIVYVDENDEVIEEAAIRQWKLVGSTRKQRYRCMAGPKKGKLVSKPGGCAVRKDPKRKRIGRKVMRAKKGTIIRKSKLAKRKGISKMLRRLNARLMGKT